MKPSELITTKEVAKRLELTQDAVLKRVRAGHLPYATKAPGLRGAYLFDPRVIDKLANQTTQAS